MFHATLDHALGEDIDAIRGWTEMAGSMMGR